MTEYVKRQEWLAETYVGMSKVPMLKLSKVEEPYRISFMHFEK